MAATAGQDEVQALIGAGGEEGAVPAQAEPTGRCSSLAAAEGPPAAAEEQALAAAASMDVGGEEAQAEPAAGTEVGSLCLVSVSVPGLQHLSAGGWHSTAQQCFATALQAAHPQSP